MQNRFSGLILLAITTAALPACTGEATPATGTLEAPVTAVGASGATYHLPQGTVLLVSTTGDFRFTNNFEFDDNVADLSVELAAGAYDTALFNPAGYTTIWPLTRVSPSGQTTTVQGILQPLPAIQIVEGQTTDIAVQFVVQGEAPISFGHGSLNVGLTVTETGSDVHEITITTSALQIQSGTPTADAPPELAARLPAEGTGGLSLTATARTLAAWTAVADNQVCTFVHVTLSGSPEISDLLAETQGQNQGAKSNLLCITTTASTGHSQVTINLANEGPALTPLLADLGAPNYLEVSVISAFVPVEVVSDFTLHLDRLDQTPALFGSAFLALFALTDTASNSWLQMQAFSGDPTTVTATPVFNN